VHFILKKYFISIRGKLNCFVQVKWSKSSDAQRETNKSATMEELQHIFLLMHKKAHQSGSAHKVIKFPAKRKKIYKCKQTAR
jgi:hypothetical protein